MGYHLSGIISTVFFLLSLVGLIAQLQLILKRKTTGVSVGESPSTSISLNQLSSSYFSYWVFFIYGFVLERFNHYLVWPRLMACLILVVVVFEVWKDRKDRASGLILAALLLSLILGLNILIWGLETARQLKQYSQWMIVFVTLILAQGYAHQILKIVKEKRTGGVSLLTHQLTFLKDIATITFGWVMGVDNGWPLILMCGVSATTKIGVFLAFWRVRGGDSAKI